jgi:carboxylesterase
MLPAGARRYVQTRDWRGTDLPLPGANMCRMSSCLVLHGLGGGPYELGRLVDALRGEGLRVATPILPGHEGPGPVMPASLWRDWAAAAESAFDVLAATAEPVACVGFSTGATLGLYLASRRPIARLVLLAPFMAIRYTSLLPIRPKTYMRALARMLPNLPRRAPAVRDRAMRRWAAEAAHFKTFSLAATESAVELIEHVRPLVPAITAPTLIIQGLRDTVVAPAGASWLYRHLGSTDKTIVTLPRSDHLLALDHDRDRVIALSTAFLTGREPR